jgi:hypothetical protein
MEEEATPRPSGEGDDIGEPETAGGGTRNRSARHRKMPESEKWSRTHIANRLMVWTTAVVAFGTLFYAGAAVFQVYMQKRSADETAKQTDKLIVAAERLAYATTTAQQDARKANVEMLNKAERLTRANEELVKTATTQANASKVQANTSRVLASAAKDSAQIARQVYESDQQPQIYFSSMRVAQNLVVGSAPWVEFTLKNSGKKASGFRIETAAGIVPSGFEGAIPAGTVHAVPIRSALEQNETTQFMVRYFKVSDDLLRGVKEKRLLIIFYGCLYYEDKFRQQSSIPFCRLFNAELFPALELCPDTIKPVKCEMDRKPN